MKIHFIGIGGIGMSALAQYYLAKGFLVSGSDLMESEIVKDLRKLGAEVFTPEKPAMGQNDLLPERARRASGRLSVDPSTRPRTARPCSGNNVLHHRKENLPLDTDLVICSAAVPEDNPELREAKRRGIKCQTYAESVGELTKKYFTIAISGMHGKSTTTAMIALILVKAGLDPTVIVGTKLREFGNSNFRLGRSRYLVIEADEWHASFLNYWPKIIVLTNIEREHLDYYKNLNNILRAFKKYLSHLSSDGILVANEQDKNISQIIKGEKCKIIYYPSSKNEARVKNIDNHRVLDFASPALRSNNNFKGLELMVPGRHNLMNAYAAIAAARAMKIPDSISIKALNNFKGAWRRFEYKGMVNGAKIFDDYGHHPTEIKATLQAAREYFNNLSLSDSDKNSIAVRQPKLWCIFQPHQYQRTYQLFNQFVSAFDEADKVILLPIYSVAGRERASIVKSVSSKKLVDAIRIRNQKLGLKDKETNYLDSFDKAVKYLRENLKKGDLAIVMGAGDIYKLTEKLGCG